MIRHFLQIICDVCENSYNPTPVLDDMDNPESIDRLLLKTAEEDGWVVQRLVRDISYGSALCRYCRSLPKKDT